jgi:hypothetical protein
VSGVTATSAAVARQTAPSNALSLFGWTVIPRRAAQAIDVSRLDVRRMSAQALLSILSDMSPEVSLALWNELRLTVGEYRLIAKKPTGDTPDATAQAAVDEIVAGVNQKGGGLESLLVQWVQTLFLQGAAAAELIPTEDLKDVSDVIAVQPYMIEYRRDPKGAMAPWAPDLKGEVKALNEQLFWYVPLDSEPDDPYGRAPASPVIGEVMFNLQLFADLKAAIHTNAWGRLDVTVLRELVQAVAVKVSPGNATEAARWMESQLGEIQSVYNSLQPDDTFIHWDWVKVGNVDSSGKVLQIAPLIRVLELRTIRALKQLPILMASNEGTTETHGTVQWQIYAKGIDALRRKVGWLAERILKTALELRGIQARVEIEWEPLRTTDRKLDAEAEGLEIANEIAKRDQGWITQNDSSIAVTGTKAVGEAPVALPAPVPATLTVARDSLPNIRRVNQPAVRMTEPAMVGDFRVKVRAAFADLADRFPAAKIAEQLASDAEQSIARVVSSEAVRVDYSARAKALVDEWFRGEGQVWAEDFAASLESYHGQTWNYGGKRALAELGIDGDFDLTNSDLLDRIGEKAASQVARINRTSADSLTSAAVRALEAGGGKAEITRALEAEFADWAGERSALIARAEFGDQIGAVSHEVYLRNGVPERDWVTMRDDKVETICFENENASPLPISQPFPSGHMAPLAHPRCRCHAAAHLPADWQAPETPWTGG